MISLTLTGPVVPFVRVCGERRTDRARRYHEWKAAAAMELAVQCPRPLPVYAEVDVRLEVVFYRHHKAGDLDNLVKALADAGNGVLYTDDRQIVQLAALLVRGAKGQDFTEVRVGRPSVRAAMPTFTIRMPAAARGAEA